LQVGILAHQVVSGFGALSFFPFRLSGHAFELDKDCCFFDPLEDRDKEAFLLLLESCAYFVPLSKGKND
jgi:hypothetical protein